MKKEENSYFIFLPVLPNRDSPARITGRSRSAAYAAPGKGEKSPGARAAGKTQKRSTAPAVLQESG